MNYEYRIVASHPALHARHAISTGLENEQVARFVLKQHSTKTYPDTAWTDPILQRRAVGEWEEWTDNPNPEGMPWLIKNLLEAGVIMGLDPREMLLTALEELAAQETTDGT